MADVTPIAGELHTQVMSVVWRLDNATVEQVRSALPARYCGAYNTVQTVLNRLGGGGLLSRQKAGHAIEYRPRIPGSNSIRSPSPWPSRLSPSATSGSAVSRHQWVRAANTSVRGRKRAGRRHPAGSRAHGARDLPGTSRAVREIAFHLERDADRLAQRRSEWDRIKELAASIIETQGDEIEQLEAIDQRPENAGVQEGRLGVAEHERGMDDDASMLEGAEPFDREFVDMMIAHHQGAIRMAHARLDKGENAELRELARATLRRRRSTR